MIRTGFSGYFDCAIAAPTLPATTAIAKATDQPVHRRVLNLSNIASSRGLLFRR
jgi:hypothetical protein